MVYLFGCLEGCISTIGTVARRLGPRGARRCCLCHAGSEPQVACEADAAAVDDAAIS